MKFERNEILTGLLVVITLSILVGVILLLAAPGVFRKQDIYQVFVDNAAGLKPGAPVLVAGHQIGNVAAINAPVPMAKRPPKYPEDEVLISVRISHGAVVYRNATPRLLQNGLLGEQVIDFVGGTDDAGDAQNGYKFVGERVPDLNSALPKVLAVIEPVAASATLTLSELRKTVETLNSVFGQEGDMRNALTKLRMTADNLTDITKPDGSLNQTMTNLQGLIGELRDDKGPLMGTLDNLQQTTASLNENHRLDKLLNNFQNASERANLAVKNVNTLLVGIRPSVEQTTGNLAQMTDTLKRQPWRLLWPSTKKYNQIAPVTETDTSTGRTEPSPTPAPATKRTRRPLAKN